MHPHTAASSRSRHSCKPRGEHRDAKLEAMTTLLEMEPTKSNVCGTATWQDQTREAERANTSLSGRRLRTSRIRLAYGGVALVFHPCSVLRHVKLKKTGGLIDVAGKKGERKTPTAVLIIPDEEVLVVISLSQQMLESPYDVMREDLRDPAGPAGVASHSRSRYRNGSFQGRSWQFCHPSKEISLGVRPQKPV